MLKRVRDGRRTIAADGSRAIRRTRPIDGAWAREVVALIVRGCTNREIAQELVIAEGTAVRHVANILNRLGFKSRAQVAVWAVEQTHAHVVN